MEQKRQYNLDLLRILACFMVLVIHVSAHNWSTVPPQSTAWQVFNIYNVFARSSVPLFFMLSGKLFLERDDVSFKRLFSKNILKLIFVYFLWSFLYAVDQIGIGNIVAEPDLTRLFTATVDSKYHLWYLTALVSVYLLIPVFIGLKSYKNGRVLDYIAILFVIMVVLKYSLSLLPVHQSIIDLLNKYGFGFSTLSGYFLLGHILDKYREKSKKIPSFVLLTEFFAACALTAAGSYIVSVKAGAATATLYDFFFISTFVEAVIIFTLFLRLSNLNINRTLGAMIKKISNYTLFIYLFHPFLIEHLHLWFGFDTLSLSPIISVPLISAILFVSSALFAAVLDKIPVIKKIFL